MIIDYNNLQDLINKKYITYDRDKKQLFVKKVDKSNSLIIKIKEIEILNCNDCNLIHLDITDLIN